MLDEHDGVVVPSPKFLGLTLDSRLNGRIHNDELCKKFSSVRLRNLAQFYTESILRIPYF